MSAALSLFDKADSNSSSFFAELKKRGAVISVEEDPHSEVAQEGLAEAIAKAGVAADPELARFSDDQLLQRFVGVLKRLFRRPCRRLPRLQRRAPR
jgi:hypothetical protein